MAGIIIPVTGVPKYASAAALPGSSQNGDLAVTIDTDTLYISDGVSWTAIASPSGSGVTTLAAVGSAPNANAGVISGPTLTLEPADGTHPGVLTAGAQTIGGAKTFSSTIAGSISGNAATVTTNANLTGDVTSVGNATTIANLAVTNAKIANATIDLTTKVTGILPNANTTAVTTPGTASSIVQRDANGDIDDVEPSYVCEIVEDFLGYQSVTTSSVALFQGAASGTGAVLLPAGGGALVDTAHPGIAPMTLGTSTTGNCGMWSGQVWTAGGGVVTLEWCMFWPALSDNTDTYRAIMGFNDNFSVQNDAGTNGVYLTYTNGEASGNFNMKTKAGGSATTTASTTPPIASTWNKYKIVINAAASLVTFYQNGVSMGTISSNIPAATNQNMNMYFAFRKTAGTTSRSFNIDYVKVKQIFTTPR